MQCKTSIIHHPHHGENNKKYKASRGKSKRISSEDLTSRHPPSDASVSFLFKNVPSFKNFISISFCFTLTNILSGRQVIHLPCICFDEWNGNCALQSVSRNSEGQAAWSPGLLSCVRVLGLCTSSTRSSFLVLARALGHLLFFSE